MYRRGETRGEIIMKEKKETKEKKEKIRFFRIFPWKFKKNNTQLIFKLLILNGFFGLFINRNYM